MNTEDEYVSTAGMDEPDEPSLASNGGSIFPHAHDFTVVGGTFTANNYPATQSVPSDFRMIPWGDIDLQRDLSVSRHSGAIDRRGEHNCIRRVYSAKVDGQSSNVTVAVYRGNGAREEWRRDVARYMSIRHPNIFQIWAGASYGNLHALVFHGDLIPLNVYLNGHSPIMAAHLFGFYVREWMQVADSMSQYRPVSHTWTLWIRSSSGRLCADIMVPNGDHILDYPNRSIPDVHGPTVFDAKNDETLAIHCLSLQQYHSICARLNQRRSSFPSTAGTLFTLGAVVSWPPPASEDLRDVGHEIAFLPDVPCECSGWLVSGKGAVGNLMGNGWMRYDVDELFNTGREFMLFVEAPQLNLGCWLPQANNVFSSQHIESNWEDYTLIDRVCFKVIVGNPTAACPPGYLFLCPEEDFQVGTSSFKWPDNPAYWSLDASGVERLSTKEATELGFPPLELSTRVQGYAWDASIYAGLRKFHQAKGFDPESQEVARHLGLPLYRLSGNIGSPFAHVEEHEHGEEDDDGDHHEEVGDRGTEKEDGESEDCEDVETDGKPTESQQSDAGGAISQSVVHWHTTDENIPVTVALKVLMNIQLVLMLFLATWWACDDWQ